MNERQRRFVEHYLACRNATEAARRAGYSPLGAGAAGSRMLRCPAILAALAPAGTETGAAGELLLPLRRDANGLNPRQRRFVAEYGLSRNAKDAARRAGYSPSHAAHAGSALLRMKPVIAALRAAGVAIVLGVHPRDQQRKQRASYQRRSLTARQRAFVAHYLVHGNAAKAALAAGFTARSAATAGWQVLQRPLVAAAIAAERAKLAERTQIDAARVVAEYARIAFANIGDFVDWGPGVTELRLKDDLSIDERAAILAIDTKTDAHGTVITRIKLQSKLAALDALARHFGLDGKGAGKPAAPPAHDKRAREELRRRILRIAENLAAELAKKKA